MEDYYKEKNRGEPRRRGGLSVDFLVGGRFGAADGAGVGQRAFGDVAADGTEVDVVNFFIVEVGERFLVQGGMDLLGLVGQLEGADGGGIVFGFRFF